MDWSLLGFDGLRQVFNIHPVFVHFPLALFPSALLLYGLGVALNWRTGCVAGRACLYLAAASTVTAVATGLWAQGSFPHNDRIHHMMQTHQTLGIVLGVIAVLLVVWSFLHKAQRPKAAYLFLGLLAFGTVVALQNGDLGARMVFVEGAAVKPAVEVVSGGHGHEAATGHHEGHAESQDESHKDGHEHSH